MSTQPPPKPPRAVSLVPEEPARDLRPVFASPGELDDLSLLPRQMRLVAGEVSDLVALMRGAVVPALKRIEERQQDEEKYSAAQVRRLHERIDELQAQIAGSK